MDKRNKLEVFLETLFIEKGPEGVVENLSLLFGAFLLTKDGIVVGANGEFLELLAYEHYALDGMPALELVPDRHKYRLTEIYATRRTEPYIIDLLTQTGSTIHTLVSPVFFRVKDEEYRLAEFVDITDTLCAEIGQSESEDKYNALFSHGAVGIARIAPDGSCLEVNQKLCEILGYSEPELMALSFREVTHPDDLEKNTTMVMELLADKRDYYSLEKRYIRKNGDVIWCRLSASIIRDSHRKPLYVVVFVEDIDDRIKLTERLQMSDLIFSASSDMLSIIDEHGNYKATNKAYETSLNLPPNYFVGKNVDDVFGKKFTSNVIRPQIARALAGDAVSYSEWFDVPSKGKRYFNVSYSLIDNFESVKRAIVVSAQDVTEQKLAEIEMRELNEKLERFSFIDGLTEITNRRMLDESLTKEWNRALRIKSPLAFIMIDIDYFKKYNDHYGHLQGDECLKKIASILNTIANRSSDVVARYGGEEFAILAPYSDLSQANELAEICRNAVEEAKIAHAFTDDPALSIVTISIGVSSFVPDESNSALELIELADQRLYKAKHAGRNCVCST